jgi:histidyl-tRNA synthetase
MSKGPQRIRGTQDIWGEASDRFQAVVAAFDRVRRLYGFQRIETPVFESTDVFARSIGETSDIVSKEMYTFPDRGGDALTLRPEFTAGICRAYLSEGWQQHAPMKVATHGPVFRYERPQKGRFRQFHQLDAEIIGTDSPLADVELLTFADQLLHELGIADGVTLQLNTLGDAETREAWRSALVAHFEAHRAELSDDSLVRLAKNPLRILDSKDPRDRPAADSAPTIDDFLSPAASDFFAQVTAGLDAAGVEWTRNAGLVRGLDYYRHTAFEFVTDRLGAQGTVLAGGRYDGLIETMGGPHTPAVGWAAGIERLAMLLDPSRPSNLVEEVVELSFKRYLPDLEVVPSNRADEQAAANFAQVARKGRISVLTTFGGNPNKRFEKARDRGIAGAVAAVGQRGEKQEIRVVNVATSNENFSKLERRLAKLPGMGAYSVRNAASGPYMLIWSRDA